MYVAEPTHHVREREKEKGATAKGINCPNRGEAEEPVRQSEPKGAYHGLEVTETGLLEDGGGEESNDVDPTKLLRKHDREGGKISSTNPWNREKLYSALQKVGLADYLMLDVKLSVDIVNISSDLYVIKSQFPQRRPRVSIAISFHKPSRRFGAQIN